MNTTPREPLLSDEQISDLAFKNEGRAAATRYAMGTEVREAYEAARAKDYEEIAKWKGIVKGVHGALNDIGTVPVPPMDADLYDAVMAIRAKDAELIQRLVDALKKCKDWAWRCSDIDVSTSMQMAAERHAKEAEDVAGMAYAAGFKPSDE